MAQAKHVDTLRLAKPGPPLALILHASFTFGADHVPMIWKNLSIERKLFAAIIATTGLIVLVMTLWLMVTMRAGFERYLLNAEMTRFEDMATNLAEIYDPATAGWPQFTQRRGEGERAWRAFTRQQLEPQSGIGNAPPPVRPSRPPPGMGRSPSDDVARAPRRPGPVDPLQIGNRLALENADGQTIAGPPLLPSPTARREIVAMEGQNDRTVLGYLVLAAPTGGREADDAVFLNDQLRMLFIVALIAIGLSAFAAYFLARQFTTPVNELIKGTERLKRGDFAERMMTERRDEFGQLIESFNGLAAHLEASEKAERQWMSDTSHELKTPLAILRAEIEAIQDGVRAPDEKNMANLHDAVLRLQDLVQDISALAQAREGQLLVSAEEHDLSALVAMAADNSRPTIEDAGLALMTVIEPNIRFVCDQRRIGQLMQNLLVNSSRYTSAPGDVRIDLARRDSIILLTVSDSAPCPADASIGQLFDRFYRDETSRSRHLGGSGLGLAICREIVVAHGGSITARHSELGGLCVSIRFDAKKRDENDA